MATRFGGEVVAEIPFAPEVVEALERGLTAAECGSPAVREAVDRIRERVSAVVRQTS